MWRNFILNWASRFAFSLEKVGNLERGREILEEVIQERSERLEEILNEERDDWDEEDRKWYIADSTSEKQAFEAILMNFPLDRLPPMDFLTPIKTECHLYGCCRHGHPEFHSKE